MQPKHSAVNLQKISYISDVIFPVQKANAEQLINTTAALASEGINITLIIPRKWRSLGKSRKKLKQQIVDFYHIEGKFKLRPLLHLPFASFTLNKIWHGLFAPVYGWLRKSDIIYTRNSLAGIIALWLGKKVLFEVYRIYDESQARSDGAVKLAQKTRTSQKICIICHSSPSKESLVAAGANPNKIRVIYNGFNPKPLTPALTQAEARKIVGWNTDEKVVCFAGRVDENKGIPILLDLAERTPEINYTLIGFSENDDEDWVEREALWRKIKNVRKLPWVTTGDLAKFLFAADVLIIPPTATPLNSGRTVLPIKTFIYMAAGRVILAPELPDIKTVLNHSNAVLVPPDDVTKSVAAIRRIFAEPQWAKQIAAKARYDSEKYTWQSRAQQIISFMDEMWFSRK